MIWCAWQTGPWQGSSSDQMASVRIDKVRDENERRFYTCQIHPLRSVKSHYLRPMLRKSMRLQGSLCIRPSSVMFTSRYLLRRWNFCNLQRSSTLRLSLVRTRRDISFSLWAGSIKFIANILSISDITKSRAFDLVRYGTECVGRVLGDHRLTRYLAVDIPSIFSF